MLHPIISNRRNVTLYVIFWVLNALLHITFLYQFYHATIYLAVADALIFNALFAVIGLGLWYAVKFSQMETHNVGSLFFNHLMVLSITLVSIFLFGYYSLSAIPVLNDGYRSFFYTTLFWRVLMGAIQYILVVLVYYLIMYYFNFIEKINVESDLKTNVKVAELNVLKSQINPHFLFNSLNSISALTVNEPLKAREMISKLSDFLRFSLTEKPDAMQVFAVELDNISRYLEIEKIRFGDRLEIKKDLAKKCLEAQVPSLILQPIVENAIKHGLSEKLGKVEIRIVADCFHGYLKVQIENDCDENKRLNNNGTGIGLQNISERLKLIYGREDLLSYRKEPGSFLVTITIPQNETNDTHSTN